MSGPSLADRELGLLQQLTELAADRARREAKATNELIPAKANADREAEAARTALLKRRDQQVKAARREYESALASITGASDTERANLKASYDAAHKQIAQQYKAAVGVANKAIEEAKWQAHAVFESAGERAKKKHEGAVRRLAEATDAFEAAKTQTEHLLAEQRRFLPPGGLPDVAPEAAATGQVPDEVQDTSDSDPISLVQAVTAKMEPWIVGWIRLGLPRLLRMDAFLLWTVLLAATLSVALAVVTGSWTAGGIAGGLGGLILAVVLRTWMMSIARVQVVKLAVPLKRAIAEGEAAIVAAREWVASNHQRRKAEAEAKREGELSRANEAHVAASRQAARTRERNVQRVDEQYLTANKEALERRDAGVAALEADFQKITAEDTARFEAERDRLQATLDADAIRRTQDLDAFLTALREDWSNGLARIRSELAAIEETSSHLFPDWHETADPGRPYSKVSPDVLKFGRVRLALARIPHGIPRAADLKAITPDHLDLPAFLSFPNHASMFLRVGESGREEAVKAIQTAMVRYLTAVPPSKVRFTIIDPVGLGQNFAPFMHLADVDELLVNSRIWTESAQIEQKLLDLTEHMENVIQSYLRNDYATIEEYNAQAGEVAEPYRVLVVANFPANFSDTAVRRLQSIVASGSRCGVHVLMSADTTRPLSHGFTLKDFEANCVPLIWKDGKFVWRDSAFEPDTLTIDEPPTPEDFTPIVKLAGDRALRAGRVEVPFEIIAPPAKDQWWTSDSRGGIDLALGRAGATKLQHLRLGKGTSQHVLIAGKTGSGKSTLLHALITNVALHYSPEEVQLYLIDFKKGVEFKTYATHALPHARVVAVESEREFGLSVLQRLDQELKIRGDKYREVGAQDVASYRAATGQPLPRLLLVVDEFQEFFVEDDKLAQECALLLDRLVRQGRAFGIHVHLGSQTLSGAYSLARSTIGQMAVRIALQCSESDAHLILSEENSAARLLTRPGEAIYNDANGLVEGNHVFQVVWLPDSRREEYLKSLHALATERKMLPKEPQLVFEGNLPADISRNALLASRLEADTWPDAPKAPHAWLGEAIAIKDPTSAVFRRQSGSHLLLTGQQDETAMGILSMAVVGLAAQHTPGPGEGSAKFYLFDGSTADSPLVGKLGRLADALPHPVRNVAYRELGSAIGEVYEELDRRQREGVTDAPSIYLVIQDLGRFRDLRKSEDDYGFSRMGDDTPPSPSKQFTQILREGPGLGIHVLAWCDTLNNLNRTFDRQSVGEFEMRVLFQMSAGDSSALIDSPAAGRLGMNRALFYSEEQGKLEKFRPYSLPEDAWLESIKAAFASRETEEVAVENT